jgi:hypothetical protein
MTRMLVQPIIVAVVVAGACLASLGVARRVRVRSIILIIWSSGLRRITMPWTKAAVLVERYVLEVYLGGASVPAWKVDLRKPTPAADGLIHVDLSSLPIVMLGQGRRTRR